MQWKWKLLNLDTFWLVKTHMCPSLVNAWEILRPRFEFGPTQSFSPYTCIAKYQAEIQIITTFKYFFPLWIPNLGNLPSFNLQFSTKLRVFKYLCHLWVFHPWSPELSANIWRQEFLVFCTMFWEVKFIFVILKAKHVTPLISVECICLVKEFFK